MFTMSQNARAIFETSVGALCPTEVHLAALSKDRLSLKEVVTRALGKGYVPFNHARFEELVRRYDRGDLRAPGVGSWVVVTDRWKKGVFILEFTFPAPVPRFPALSWVNFSSEVKAPYGLRHKFLFNSK